MKIKQISKEDHRILLNGRIDAIRTQLKRVPKWRNRLYQKNADYQLREFHLQNVLRKLSTNEELTTLLEEIVSEFESEEKSQQKRTMIRLKRTKINLPNG